MSIVRKRDSQKNKLYIAERVAFPAFHHVTYATDEAIQKNYIAKIVKSSWWKKHCSVTCVLVEKGKRVGADAFQEMRRYQRPDGSFVRLPTGIIRYGNSMRNEYVTLHELAHIIIWDHQKEHRWTDHGPEFAKVFLMLVRRFLGKSSEKTLKDAFKEHRVDCRTSFKPVPTKPLHDPQNIKANIVSTSQKTSIHRYTQKVSDALDVLCVYSSAPYFFHDMRERIRDGRLKQSEIYSWVRKFGYVYNSRMKEWEPDKLRETKTLKDQFKRIVEDWYNR